jgi:hypothetical protein
MTGQRIIKVPASYYRELRDMQSRLLQERRETVPLWKCTQELAIDKQRWRDDVWFNRKNRKGNLFDMFWIMFTIAIALIVIVMAQLFISGLNDSIQASDVPSRGKQFIGTFDSQNDWVLDFLFVMLLISLPLVSAILAYFNNIPPFLFWASIGVLLLVVVLANIVGDAYTNLTTAVGGISNVTSALPMTNYIMSHFVIYAILCSFVIMFGVFIKPQGQYQ